MITEHRSRWSVNRKMKPPQSRITRFLRFSTAFQIRLLCLLFLITVCTWPAPAQKPNQSLRKSPISTQRSVNVKDEISAFDLSSGVSERNDTDTSDGDKSPSESDPARTQAQFRVERLPLIGGSELLTIFGRLDGVRSGPNPAPEVPLLSILRDTLGDDNPENDRLRYVWMMTYTRPTVLKRAASAIPFLYQHTGNHAHVSAPPKPLLDLTNTGRQTWNRLFSLGMQNALLDTYGLPLRASTRAYRRNAADYRSAHVTQALTILENYEKLRQRSRDESELIASNQPPADRDVLGTSVAFDSRPPLLNDHPVFSIGEMLELRARLILSRKFFGGLFGPDSFRRTVEKHSSSSIDASGHNWELLRQRAEAEGFYFEPLAMPDGRATHALLWISKSDLTTSASRHFHGRFLNIRNPWNDRRLSEWRGYTETRYFDDENRQVTAAEPNSHAVEMIPLALYGLDHPKIPAVLVDFRDYLNPKKREMSRRIFGDLTKDIFSLSSFGNAPYFLGRKLYYFVTGQRGMDLNQPSRLRSYAELKLLLSFNASIAPGLQSEIQHRLENVSLNPLSNNNQAELQIARQQYFSLIEFARRPNGLPAKVDRDRRAEMVALEHGRAARFFFELGNVLSCGRYVHRETETPELMVRLELARRLEHHEQFLREVSKAYQIEVVWDMETVRRSLHFLSERGAGASASATRAAAKIFQRTADAEARRLCLGALAKIHNRTSKKELLRLYREEQPRSEWRAAIAEHLRKAVADDGRMKPAEVKSVLNELGPD